MTVSKELNAHKHAEFRPRFTLISMILVVLTLTKRASEFTVCELNVPLVSIPGLSGLNLLISASDCSSMTQTQLDRLNILFMCLYLRQLFWERPAVFMGSQGVANTLLTQHTTPPPHLNSTATRLSCFVLYLPLAGEGDTSLSAECVALTGITYVPISLPPSSTASSQH